MPKLTLKELESKIDSDGCLDLSMSQLSSLTCLSKLKNSKKLSKIRKLDLSDNNLELNFNDQNQPENRLTIHNDKLKASCPIPEILFKNVTSINLANNKIGRLPSYFGFFTNLQKLDLYQNQIASKTNLETLSSNSSGGFSEGPALASLNLDVFGSLTKLKWLDLTGNPLAINEHQFSPIDAKNLQEIKKLINIHDSSITARNVVNYCVEKFQVAAKRRIKNKKKAEKQEEKQAKALKIKQKEERRKAYEERQEAERLRLVELEKEKQLESNDNESFLSEDFQDEKCDTSIDQMNSSNVENSEQPKGIIARFTSFFTWLVFLLLKIGFVALIAVIGLGALADKKKIEN